MARPPSSGWNPLPEGWTWGDVGHGALDVAGLVPVLGEGADVVNAAWYAGEGKYLDAGLSIISMVPIVGDAIGKGGRLVKAGATKLSGPALRALKKMDFKAVLGPFSKHPKIGPHVDKIVDALEKWRAKATGSAAPSVNGVMHCPVTSALARGTGKLAQQSADNLARMSTHKAGSADRVVLGKHPDYINEAKKNGGTWFETPDTFYDQLVAEVGKDAASQKAWLVNRAFLEQQLKKGVGNITMNSKGLLHAVENPQSMSAKELIFLKENASRYGYTETSPGNWLRR
jgi:hypothetical protein